MAQVNLSSSPAADLYLLPGEVPETRDLEDARQWVSIYRELVTFSERTLTRLRNGGGDADERVMEAHPPPLRPPLEFSERPPRDVAGPDLDGRPLARPLAG